MTDYQIISKQAVSNAEVLETIKGQGKPEEELTYREDKIITFLKNQNPLSVEKFNEAKNEMEELEIPRLAEENILRIIDLKPKNGTEIRAIVNNNGIILVDENVTKILDVLKKYY